MNLKKIYSYSFLIPALALYTIIFMVPVVIGFVFSFTNWNSMSDTVKFIGLANFAEIFVPGGPYFDSLIRTFVFTFMTVLVKMAFGLALALLVNEGIKSRGLLRGVYFLPHTLAPLIIGIVFSSILGAKGVVNQALRGIGLDVLARSWLANKDTVMGAVISVESWRMIGWNMVMFLAGLQSIPGDYYEAASIDGASAVRKFTTITAPLLMPTITITTVLNIIHGLKAFDIIFALTGGGPGRLTEVMNVAVFNEFSIGRYGMSTALGIVVFAITALIALLVKGAMTGKEA